MPILYEDTFPKPQPQVEKFAWVKDSEKTLTISLAAGKGIITKVSAFDPANPAVDITSAAPGQEFSLYIEVTNQGSKDTCWCGVRDKDTDLYIKTVNYPQGIYHITTLDAGKKFGLTVGRVVMPNKKFNILVQAGHGTA